MSDTRRHGNAQAVKLQRVRRKQQNEIAKLEGLPKVLKLAVLGGLNDRGVGLRLIEPHKPIAAHFIHRRRSR